jgi:hypothetical protein
MAQNFTPGTPATASVPQSVTMRDNFEALLTNHAGPVMPAYAAEGMTWFDSSVDRLKKIRALGSKAYVNLAMGAQINLAVALVGAGQDGSLITADCRLQDVTLLPGPNRDWSLVGGDLHLFFSNEFNPAFYARTFWDDPVIGEPIFWSNDGILTGKVFETIISGHEILYGTSVLSNQLPFESTSLRAVEIEQAGDEVRLPFETHDVDHVVLDTGMQWWEWQDSMYFELWVNGVRRHNSTFKARPMWTGSSVKVVVYNIDPMALLTNFTSYDNELRIRKQI